MLKFVLFYLLGFSISAFPPTQEKGESFVEATVEVSAVEAQLPSEIVDQLLRIAAQEWCVPFEDLKADYESGLLVITHISGNKYEVFHPYFTGTLTILLETGGGKNKN